MINKCALCGKFRKKDDLIGVQAEGDEIWLECKFCCSEIDYKTYFKKET